MKRSLAAIILGATCFAVAPSQAVPIPGGCAVVTAGSPGTSSCSYIATGRATWIAVTASGYDITVIKPDRELRWRTGQAFGGCGIHAVLPQYGVIPSEPGDTVTIGIRTACHRATIQPPPLPSPAPGQGPIPVGFTTQSGFVAASERIPS